MKHRPPASPRASSVRRPSRQRSRRFRTFPAWWLACFLPGVLATGASAEESDAPRAYLGLRGADTNPMTEIHDAWGLTLGMNVNRYLGFELAGDNFEKSINPKGYQELGEYAVWSFVPQIRLRYPMQNGRLVPYVIGGVGGAFTQFNDRKPAGFGLDIATDSAAFMASIGGGVEYHVADNISLGIELKYLASSAQDLKVDGRSYDLSASAPLMMVSLRLHAPEVHRTPMAEQLEPVPTRYYVGFRAGGALPLSKEAFPGIRNQAEPPAYGNTLDQLFGLVVGLNFGRHLSAELSIEGYETVLAPRGIGAIGEYAVADIMPQIRLREPLLDGRLVPYAIAGVGFGYHEFNDRKPAGADIEVETQPYGVAATLGAGVEYFVVSNVAFNFETRYLFSRGQTIQLNDGPRRSGNLDALLISLGLRVYFPGLRPAN